MENSLINKGMWRTGKTRRETTKKERDLNGLYEDLVFDRAQYSCCPAVKYSWNRVLVFSESWACHKSLETKHIIFIFNKC